MNPQTIILIGRSGCGKGSQAKLIAEHLQKNDAQKRPVYYLETGAKFREFIQEESFSSRLSKEIAERAERQPDFLAIWMWSNLLVKDLTGEEHIIFDGMPRSLAEATTLDNALQFYKRKANIVYINVSRVLSERRLLERGRDDDSTIQKITKRLDWFDKDVVPAIEYYKKGSVHNLVEVNGERPVETVHDEIISRLILR